MNDVQKYEPQVVYVDRPAKRWSKAQTVMMVLAIMYWVSPIDLIPFVPIDDIAVMIVAFVVSNLMGGDES